jgi:Holliday junction resolvase RusA-like endonuclease
MVKRMSNRLPSATDAGMLPPIIQGGMGVGVSGWRLARAVSMAGQLGVVSGTALDLLLTRQLQLGDPGGHLRRALGAFPIPGAATRILEKFFIAGGKPRFFKKANVAAAENDLVSLLAAYRPEDCSRFQTGPLAVKIELYFPYRKSERKEYVNSLSCVPCDTRPDLDNLSKMILDAMTRCGYWRDDGQVACLTISKWWHGTPGISISINKAEVLP